MNEVENLISESRQGKEDIRSRDFSRILSSWDFGKGKQSVSYFKPMYGKYRYIYIKSSFCIDLHSSSDGLPHWQETFRITSKILVSCHLCPIILGFENSSLSSKILAENVDNDSTLFSSLFLRYQCSLDKLLFTSFKDRSNYYLGIFGACRAIPIHLSASQHIYDKDWISPGDRVLE